MPKRRIMIRRKRGIISLKIAMRSPRSLSISISNSSGIIRKGLRKNFLNSLIPRDSQNSPRNGASSRLLLKILQSLLNLSIQWLRRRIRRRRRRRRRKRSLRRWLRSQRRRQLSKSYSG
jgi:hypothetical protein